MVEEEPDGGNLQLDKIEPPRSSNDDEKIKLGKMLSAGNRGQAQPSHLKQKANVRYRNDPEDNKSIEQVNPKENHISNPYEHKNHLKVL